MKHLHLAKTFYFILVITIFNSNSLQGNLLPYDQPAPLIRHLSEVNGEWPHQPDVDLDMLSFPISFTTDEQRIKLHLQLVNQLLSIRKGNRNDQQQANRLNNLKNLKTYWQRGLFPKNTKHPYQRKPYFIDVYGTACAVGHLMQTSGEEQFADQIANENNFAWIQELVSPKLLQWASENGFTLAELAWIQPQYGAPICYSAEPIANTWPLIYEKAPNVSPDIKTLFTLPNDSLMLIGGNFKALTTAGSGQNIVGWTGSDLVHFDTTIIGTVHAIEYYDNTIFIGGDFHIENTNFYNIAWWDGTAWQGIQTGPMGGIVYALKWYECNLYAGGDFTTVANAPMPYIAAWDGTTWSNLPLDCDGAIPPTLLQTNGTVRAFEVYKEGLIVGGLFSSVGNNLRADAMDMWKNGWQSSYSRFLLPYVYSLDVNYFNTLWIGSNWVYSTHYLWDYAPNNTNSVTTSHVCKNFSVINATDGVFSIQRYYGPYGATAVVFNGDLNALEWFQGEIYAGGMFEYIVSSTVSSILCEENVLAKSLVKLKGTPALPVEMHSFEVELTSPSKTDINWTTDAEFNSDFFGIERRSDSQPGFISVGEVQAAGESNNRLRYKFTDDVSALKGTLYYRLKMVDSDGSFVYSDLKSVQLPERDKKLSIFPSPAQDHLNITLNVPRHQEVTINVYSIQGQLMYSIPKHLKQNELLMHTLDVKDLANGLYIIEVLMGDARVSDKFKVMR